MAEEQNNTSALQTANNVKEGAKLAKDTARLAGGDVTAIKDVLLNKYVIGAILGFVLIIALVGMCIGASINGVINYIAASWEENWEENWTDQGIASEGNLTYLQTTGWILTLGDTVSDVISDVYNAVTSKGIAAGAGTSDNQQIQNDDIQAAGNNPDASDYDTTMQAILDSVKLDQALTDRLNMIEGRVKQRGLQIKSAAITQYLVGIDNEYDKIADALSKEMESATQENNENTMVFYAGYNQELSEENLNFDISAFELSNLQALKILAIFSIQYDCQLTDMDMWTLMDYCGWYVPGENDDLNDMPDSIYEVVYQSQSYGNDIGSVVQKGQSIPLATYEFPELQVPAWTGTCAPQWYYEELAQIRKHNKEYFQYAQNGNIPDGMISWGSTSDIGEPGTYYILHASKIATGYRIPIYGGYTQYSYTYNLCKNGTEIVQTYLDPNNKEDLVFKNLESNTSYTIQRVYTMQTFYDGSTQSPLYTLESLEMETFTTDTVAQSAVAPEDVNIDRFTKLEDVETFGIIDRLYYSAENNLTVNRTEYASTDNWTREQIQEISEEAYEFWDKYVWGRSETTLLGSTITRDDAGNHSYTYGGIFPSSTITSITIPILGINYTYETETTSRIVIYDPDGNEVESKDWQTEDKDYTNLTANTQYTVVIITDKYYRGYKNNELISETVLSDSTLLETFTTFPEKGNALAYELYISINLSFKARSVDELAFDVLGIWPGSLNDTTQVVRKTASNNLIGKTTDINEKYSYCLEGGTFKLIDYTGSQFFAIPDGTYEKLKRPVSSAEEDCLSTSTTIYEYGIADSTGLTNVNDTPIGGWKTVTANADQLVFEIIGEESYLVYARITNIKTVLNIDGTTKETTTQYLYQIDMINPHRSNGQVADTTVTNGDIYAAGHLGNSNMLLTWKDKYTDDSNTMHTLTFNRMTGYQYESYVDMVMALCELLEIPYDDWEPAIKRAQELKLTIDN